MSPWKACDIRGKFPDEVTPELFRSVGCAAASLLPANARVLVAGDFRQSTNQLRSALVAGLAGGGLRILDAGQIPTPIAYFAHRRMKTDAVFIVTASHNPADHNGLKLMFGSMPPDEALFDNLREPAVRAPKRTEGTVEAVDAVAPYRTWMEDRWRRAVRNFESPLVIDAGNGAWSELAPSIMTTLGLTVDPLFCRIDSRFPNRAPDSARSANLTVLCERVKATGALLGIAWDGDGDRVAFVDRDGRAATADQVSILLARYQLAAEPSGKAVYDIKLSDRVRQAIEEAGGTAIMERSGHAFLKRRMIDENCLLGCEASGHYFHRELAGGDDGLHTALLLLELTSRVGPLHTLLADLPELFVTPDLRIPLGAASFESVAERLRGDLHILRTSTLDGVRFDTADGTVLVRRSITEPAITIRIDAPQQHGLDRLIEVCLHSLPEMAREIRAQIDYSRIA